MSAPGDTTVIDQGTFDIAVEPAATTQSQGNSGATPAAVTSGSDPTAWDPIGIERRPDNPGNSGNNGKP